MRAFDETDGWTDLLDSLQSDLKLGLSSGVKWTINGGGVLIETREEAVMLKVNGERTDPKIVVLEWRNGSLVELGKWKRLADRDWFSTYGQQTKEQMVDSIKLICQASLGLG